MSNLANCYNNQGNFIEAEILHKECLGRRKLKIRENHPSMLMTMYTLADCYSNQGKFTEAEILFK